MTGTRGTPNEGGQAAGGPAPGDRLDPALIRLALVLMLGAFASMLDTTIVAVAINTLQTSFDTTVATVQWVSTAYLLAMSMIIPVTSWTVDRFGAKRMWLVSIVVFMIGSVLCGFAWSIGSLIAFRVVQGVGGGMLLPLVRTILAPAAGQARMGRAMIFVAVPGSLAPVLGAVLGGLVIGSLSWRWAFYINIPVCLLALVLSWVLMPNDRKRGAARLDVLGLALLSVGFAAIVFALSEVGRTGDFGSWLVLTTLILGLVLVTAYVFHALFTKQTPIIDVRLFRIRSFAASTLVLFLFGASLFGTALLLPLYYQQVHGASVFTAGMLLIPQGVGIGVASLFAGKFIDRIGAERAIAIAGMALAAGGAIPYALGGPDADLVVLAVAQFVGALGLGAAPLAATTATYAELRKSEMGPATSASRILQLVGGALGAAVLTVILQREFSANPGHDLAAKAAAFGGTFWWAIGLTGAALIPALLLPHKKNSGPPAEESVEPAQSEAR
ncbi:DHA2 family efflux MFS transporter permease subunit [Amycolatopsis sp. NPDC003676]